MKDAGAYTARPIEADGKLVDILLNMGGRELPMLGPAGKDRELALLSAEGDIPGGGTGGAAIPVLIGSGTGAALEEFLRRLENARDAQPIVAVVDKEAAILAASGLKERYATRKEIVWITVDSPNEAIRELSRLQEAQGGKPLLPLLNPFYLRLDRDYYNAVLQACRASRQANFWEKAHYPKFRQAQPRVLLLTSQYFLIGEIIGACERLGLPYRLLQVPEGEVGQNDFVARLLSDVITFRPDFLFTINHLGVDREGVLTRLLERMRLPLASWFVDNPHLILYLYTNLVSPWTSIFTWDADNTDSLLEMGFSHVSYLPLGVDATRFVPPGGTDAKARLELPSNWNSQLSFVGNSMVFKVRKRFERSRIPSSLAGPYKSLAAGFGESEDRSVRSWLQNTHPELLPEFDSMPTNEDRLNYETLLTWEATLQYRLSCIRAILPFRPLIAGDKGWREILPREKDLWHYHPELNYYRDLPRFYPRAAINFNCTSKQMKGAVNQRVFDVPATESFLLTDYREQVERLFDPGREILCYHSPEEAEALAREYLARPKDRLAIARAARKRILSEHCYEHRLRTLIQEMKKRYS